MANPRTTAPDAINLGSLSLNVSDFVSQGNAILGIRDSGKSYTATYLAEQLLSRDIPFVAFDPIGVWRFLRHGERRWSVLVAGGAGADVPLTVESALPILRHAMSHDIPLVFDLFDITLSKADWRRIVEACVRELLYKNTSPRHVFIEEAAEFVPQMIQREHATVYAEIEKLARMGGNSRLGYTLINQRAEQVNKAVLELCDCLLLHRQKGRLSLTALTKWLDFGDKRATAGIIEKMPLLTNGECFVWQGGADRPTFTHIPTKQSFHPNRREKTDPGPALPVPQMVAGLEIETAPAKAKPKEPSYKVPVDAEPIVQQVPVFEPGDLAKLEDLKRQLWEAVRVADSLAANMASLYKRANEALQRAEQLRAPRYSPPPQVRSNGMPTPLSQGPQKILAVLASRHPGRITFAQCGTLTGFTPSTMRTYMPRLREAEMIDENADGITLTPAGLAAVGDEVDKMPKGGRALLDFWKTRLSQGEGAIMEALFQYGIDGKTFHGAEAAMERLRIDTGYTDSTLRTYLPTLRRNNLIHPTELKISPEFLT